MRLFVAIAIPEAVADPLCDLQGGLDGVRWVDPDDFHLTLRFAGELGAAPPTTWPPPCRGCARRPSSFGSPASCISAAAGTCGRCGPGSSRSRR